MRPEIRPAAPLTGEGRPGEARRAFVVGHPIAHSRSPLIHGHWLRTLGLPGSYERIHVLPETFEAFFRGIAEAGFAGGNVTVPHKEAAFALADELSERARRQGAANTLVVQPDGRIHADNTDGEGFLASFDEVVGPGWSEEHDTALVIGAGGAARAVVDAFLTRGLSRVIVANRTPERAAALAELDPRRVEAVGLDAVGRALGEAGILVNTTTSGMEGQETLDLDLGRLPEDAIVNDIVYVPLMTPLLAAARARGLRVVDGLGMLLHQAKPGFRAWFGGEPAVTPELRALVVADLERHG